MDAASGRNKDGDDGQSSKSAFPVRHKPQMPAADDGLVAFPVEVVEKSVSPSGSRDVHVNVGFPSSACDVVAHGDCHVAPCCVHDDTSRHVHRHVNDPRIDSVHVEVEPADNRAEELALAHVADTHTETPPSACHTETDKLVGDRTAFQPIVPVEMCQS